MSFIQYYKQPELRDPVLIAAFGGWNDAADAATTAIKYLINQWSPEKIAEIDAEDFYVYTETRPTIRYVDGMQRKLHWPGNQFLAQELPEHNRDIILCIGAEPQLKWKTFSSIFLEVMQRFHVSEVLLLGALLADVPHTLNVPISGSSSNEEILERLHEMKVHASKYEGPTGILGVLQDASRRIQLPSASLWAAVPHYLAATPNIKVTASLLTHVNTFLSLGLDLHEIQADAVRFDEQVTALVSKDPEASAYVYRLEEQHAAGLEDIFGEDEEPRFIQSGDKPVVNSGPLPSADSLIRDVEDLLRMQRENGRQNNQDDEEEE